MEMHELLCFLRFAEQIPLSDFQKVQMKLEKLVGNVVATDPMAWEQYSAQPLDFVKSPDSFLYPMLKDAVATNLDFWIDTLTDDGVWMPAWQWGQFEEDWLVAKKHIAGELTVNRLMILDKFQRISSWAYDCQDPT